jgi:hypothetical protein
MEGADTQQKMRHSESCSSISRVNIARIPVPSKKIPIGRTRRGRGVYTAKLKTARLSTLPPPPPPAVGLHPQ